MLSTSTSLQKSIVARYNAAGRYFRGTYREDGLRAVADLQGQQDMTKKIVSKNYRPREQERYLLIQEHFGRFLEGNILDVGSRDATIQQLLGPRCQLIDKNNPALPAFDWEKEQLPYGDNSFDAVVCLDVLEHINAFHQSLNDLLRVSRQYVIISLPNCWRKMFKQMLRATGTQASYGLPPEPPMDRHRWFFNTQEIEECFAYQSVCGTIPFRIVDRLYHIPRTRTLHQLVYPFVTHVLPERYTKNLLVNTAFYVLEKKNTLLHNRENTARS